MKIFIAKDAGYCFGVRDAVNIAYDTASEHGEVYMLGTIVHNERVIENLDKAGAKVVNDFEDVPDGKTLLFRAHGTSPELWKKAKNKNINLVDGTCPLVTEIHHEIKTLEKEGRKTIIIGDHGHDEVVAIAAQVEKPIIIANIGEAKKMRRIKRAGIVTQSTQMIENVQEIINVLMQKVYDLRFINTICFPTRRNHEQIKELACQCDVMVVIGSFTSANSKRLTQLSLERNKRSYQVTSAEELKEEMFNNCASVGISAGASTPDEIIEEVVTKIKKISKNSEGAILYE
ncbi:MAG: 4-hydroxy-3-methylbut-2-enyl diphosphate reductase [Candidatus Marinimicrobia bacterium]|nr:4-hydroxy-3-methylbut-2-enyl diphosphate reductase [Candidatus Neomarinimicrobiota bacterium]|tara:strand:+ start:2097 stop:2960 length:864 start_codon:yes stop_codon:yes gene_type:complete